MTSLPRDITLKFKFLSSDTIYKLRVKRGENTLPLHVLPKLRRLVGVCCDAMELFMVVGGVVEARSKNIPFNLIDEHRVILLKRRPPQTRCTCRRRGRMNNKADQVCSEEESMHMSERLRRRNEEIVRYATRYATVHSSELRKHRIHACVLAAASMVETNERGTTQQQPPVGIPRDRWTEDTGLSPSLSSNEQWCVFDNIS